MALQVKLYSVGSVAANSYIIKDIESAEAAVVDPGMFDLRFEDTIKQMGIEKIKYILLTHGHFDHIMGVERLRKSFGGQVVIHRYDEPCLSDDDKNLGSIWGFSCPEIKADILVEDGDILTLGKEKIRVIYTPGHSEGSVCYKTENVIFSGDTLFHMSVGRTDFPGGDRGDIIRSIRRLYALETEHRVCPGHNSETTLSFERDNNPFTKEK